MIDTGNLGSVDSKQFLTAAKECLEAEKDVRSNHPDVHVVLQKMSQFLRRDYVSQVQGLLMPLENSGAKRLRHT